MTIAAYYLYLKTMILSMHHKVNISYHFIWDAHPTDNQNIITHKPDEEEFKCTVDL